MDDDHQHHFNIDSLSYIYPFGDQERYGNEVKQHSIISIQPSYLSCILFNFWIGTLLLVFFFWYAAWMDLFPSSGPQDFALANNPNASTFTKVMDILHHCVYRFCISYVSFAYLSRQMRGSMSAVIKQDYIRTARAKGLKERKVIWKYAFQIHFSDHHFIQFCFPQSLSGSIAIEMIYTIPGMGYLLLLSIISRDWPVVFAIVMLVAIMTMIGNLIADILYAVIDPRVTY